MNELPNTKIKVGKLKDSDLEKIAKIYSDLNLPIFKNSLQVSADCINKTNKELNELEITPDPHFYRENKIIFEPMPHPNGNLYVNAKIHLGEYSIKNKDEIAKKYNNLLKQYLK